MNLQNILYIGGSFGGADPLDDLPAKKSKSPWFSIICTCVIILIIIFVVLYFFVFKSSNSTQETPIQEAPVLVTSSGNLIAPQPVTQQFVPQPVTQQFVPQPVTQQFVPQPVTQQFVPQPVTQQFVPQPVTQQFVPQPIVQPTIQPVIQPTIQPVVQPVIQPTVPAPTNQLFPTPTLTTSQPVPIVNQPVAPTVTASSSDIIYAPPTDDNSKNAVAVIYPYNQVDANTITYYILTLQNSQLNWIPATVEQLKNKPAVDSGAIPKISLYPNQTFYINKFPCMTFDPNTFESKESTDTTMRCYYLMMNTTKGPLSFTYSLNDSKQTKFAPSTYTTKGGVKKQVIEVPGKITLSPVDTKNYWQKLTELQNLPSRMNNELQNSPQFIKNEINTLAKNKSVVILKSNNHPQVQSSLGDIVNIKFAVDTLNDDYTKWRTVLTYNEELRPSFIIQPLQP